MISLLKSPAATTPDQWAAEISACWRQSVEAIIQTGRLIAAAKEALPHGEFTAMIESQLPFTARTAQRLMAIGTDARLTNPTHVSLLPPSWGTLYELTTLDDEQLEAKFADGTIRPDMERREVINGARSLMGSRQEPDDSLDYSPTPPWATRALCHHVMPAVGLVGKRFESVWEPACGEGHMAKILTEYSDIVIATDIFDYGYGQAPLDFLGELPPSMRADWIITNPPFRERAEQFALRALDLAQVGVAIFARLQWLETIGRYERLFRDQPPTLIAFFCERVNLCMGRWEPDGGTATAYIWLVWIKGAKPRAPFWIPPGCRESLTRTDDAERFTAHPVIKRKSEPTAVGDTSTLATAAARGEPASLPQDMGDGAGSRNKMVHERAMP